MHVNLIYRIKVSVYIAEGFCSLNGFFVFQVVPDCHPGAERPKKRTFSECSSPPADFAADIAYILGKCDEAPEFMVKVRTISLILN